MVFKEFTQVLDGRIFPAVTALLVVFSGSAFSEEQEAAPEPVVQEEVAVSTTSDAKVSIPVAQGQDVLGLRIPHFNENGELVLQIASEVARRIDQENVEMENMRIEFYDEDRQKMEIRLAKSRFNMESRILTSDTPATIARTDFTIEGDSLEFDLAEQVGTMHGDVTMTIHPTENEQK